MASRNSVSDTTLEIPEKMHYFFKCLGNDNKCLAFATDQGDIFEMHLKSHDEESMKCFYCKDLVSKVTLTAHMFTEHRFRLFQCTKCPYRAKTEQHMKIHYKGWHPKDILLWNPCEEPTSTKFVVKKESRTTAQIVSIKCPSINCVFCVSSWSGIENHCKSDHPALKNFSCFNCKEVITDFPYFKAHMRLHNIYDFHCQICGDGFETADKANYHAAQFHPDEDIMIFARKSNEPKPPKKVLKVEPLPANPVNQAKKKIVLEEVTSNFKCSNSACPNSMFVTLKCLADHMRTKHTNVDFHECPFCQARLKISDLDRHINCHGKIFLECTCPDCPFYHYNISEMETHIQECHADIADVTIVFRRFNN